MIKFCKALPYSSSSTHFISLKCIFQSQSLSSFSSFSSSSSSLPSPEHVSHLILEQKSASQALETFRWASSLPKFVHTQSTYRALIHKLCSFRRFDTVKQLLDEMPDSIGSAPRDDIFITIIRGLARAHMTRSVIKVLDLVYKFHTIPSLKIFNSILDVLVKEDIDIAREFYRKSMMECGVQGDDYTFGILMKGICLTNRIGEGFKLLQLIKSRGVTPNTVIYNTLLHSLCKNGKVGRARSLMNEMEEPNDVTFNILISAYCKEENLVQAIVMLEKCFGLGFMPDVVTVTKVVEVLCNADRVTEAAEVLDRVESMGGSLDIVAYNTLIKGFCAAGKVKVGVHFLKQMESKGFLPNVDTYNSLISGFCESRMLDLALNIFNDMKTDGIKWNFITFDTIIRGLCSEGRIEDGFLILELMEESKERSRGHISPYNSIIYGLFKQNRFDEAVEFLTKMEKMFPRAVERSLKILDHCKDGVIEDAKRVYDQMIDEGGIPSIIVYDSLVRGFSQEGSVREAVELMNEMIASNCFPVPSTFNAIITGFCREGKVESALKFMEDITARGCVPNAETYGPLIDVLCRKGDLHKALQLFLEIVEKGIHPDHFIWNSLLLSLSQENSFKSKNIFNIDELLL
ncbi:hypothetical protein Lal_00027369 [Lupinus albus]|uniref:Putative pentatricopeptide n=1 Tax=Lupinus albus TaxID=3870 RepID=A0A6A4QFR0_LUPAL|nr:putative pentatricopeptide [Lupinus albus]KAF1873331.1 hypothetical protein Lal_00027369 [Lupinus albus]